MAAKGLKADEIRATSVPEMQDRLAELKAELLKEKATIASGTRAEKPSKIKALRRGIARIITIINEKKAEAKNKK